MALQRMFGHLHDFGLELRDRLSLSPTPERQLMRAISYVVILGSTSDSVNRLQQQEAGPYLHSLGVSGIRDSLWKLADGRRVEFLSASGSTWFTRLMQAGNLVVIPLYRYEHILSVHEIQMTDARLAVLTRKRASIQVMGKGGFSW